MDHNLNPHRPAARRAHSALRFSPVRFLAPQPGATLEALQPD